MNASRRKEYNNRLSYNNIQSRIFLFEFNIIFHYLLDVMRFKRRRWLFVSVRAHANMFVSYQIHFRCSSARTLTAIFRLLNKLIKDDNLYSTTLGIMRVLYIITTLWISVLLWITPRIEFTKIWQLIMSQLTLSTPAVPNCCCLKGSAPYWSNPPFLIFDRAPECQKLKMMG